MNSPDQMKLFPGTQEITMEGAPPDIQEALSVISGTAIPSEDGRLRDPNVPSESDEEKRKWSMTMLKQHEHETHVITKKVDPHLEVIDVASEEGQLRIVEIYKLIGDPDNGYTGYESAAKTVLDHKAKRGFRSIVTVKWWKTVKDVRKSALDQARERDEPITQPPNTSLAGNVSDEQALLHESPAPAPARPPNA